MSCDHLGTVEWDPGHYIAPFGWEFYPGWYCVECGQYMHEDPDWTPTDYDD